MAVMGKSFPNLAGPLETHNCAERSKLAMSDCVLPGAPEKCRGLDGIE
jgi:hypothetical protein